MIVFTDSDLERLKEGMNAWWCENLTEEHMLAFIARLEAAECALLDTELCPCEKVSHFHLIKNKRLNAWLQSAGRSRS